MNKIEERVNKYIENLVKKYKYHKLPKNISKQAIQFYKENLPQLDNKKPIYDLSGNPIANKFIRVVIGDYGAFVEFHNFYRYCLNPNDLECVKFSIPEDQKFRNAPDFKGNYHWLTSDGKNKIYKQIRPVSYANYLVGYYYISPYEITQKD